MFVDPFGFQAAEDTRYDVVERVAAEVGKPSFLVFWAEVGGLIMCFAEEESSS